MAKLLDKPMPSGQVPFVLLSTKERMKNESQREKERMREEEEPQLGVVGNFPTYRTCLYVLTLGPAVSHTSGLVYLYGHICCSPTFRSIEWYFFSSIAITPPVSHSSEPNSSAGVIVESQLATYARFALPGLSQQSEGWSRTWSS